ncbi:MAG: hypothetical protein CMP09_26930 [Yangia sp.]|nr:hypothetical protein [Salipiger sp.]
MSGTDARNEQHKQSSHKDNLDSEQAARCEDTFVTDALSCSTVEALGLHAEKAEGGIKAVPVNDAEEADDVATAVHETNVEMPVACSETGTLQKTTPIATEGEGMDPAQEISSKPADTRTAASTRDAQTAAESGAKTGRSEACAAETEGHQGQAIKRAGANADVAETNTLGAFAPVAPNLAALRPLGATLDVTGTEPGHSAKSCIKSHGQDTRVPEATAPLTPSSTVDNAAQRPAPPPLRLVLGTCSEIAVFTPDPIHDWPSLIRAADKIRPMTGISDSAWHDAKSAMGAEQASATLCAMLQRFSEIRNPGGYLRHLAKKAREGTFSPTRMVMALEHRAA